MVKIRGDYIGASFGDFILEPGYTTKEHLPENIDITVDLAGMKIKPFIPAAMRAICDENFALEAAKNGLMPVVPRAYSVERQVKIIRYVKEREVRKGELEEVDDPIKLREDETLADALEKVNTYGHSNLPVVDKSGNFKGIFKYRQEYERELMQSPDMPVKNLMVPLEKTHYVVGEDRDEIKRKLEEENLRMLPVLEEIFDRQGKREYRLKKLVFRRQDDGYRIAAAIDTYPGWEGRVERVLEAGADMIFIDTSDCWNEFTESLMEEYKKRFEKPICVGNLVGEEAFRLFADLGADAIKVGMGSGSICTTSQVLRVGAAPMDALIRVTQARDRYYKETGRYIPVIADGGISDEADIIIALACADAVMLGKLFAAFEESAGRVIETGGEKYKEYWGEGSRRAFELTGDMKRYSLPKDSKYIIYQGVEGGVKLKGKLKPGVEHWVQTLKQTMMHVGAKNLKEYHEKAVLTRLTQRSAEKTGPHGILVED